MPDHPPTTHTTAITYRWPMAPTSFREPYEGVASRIEALCVDEAVWTTDVPACPGWSVADVVGHLTGLARDWTEGDLQEYGSRRWTAAQVARFAGWRARDVLDEWRLWRDRLTEIEEPRAMGDPWMWAFGDAVVHEADLVGALGTGSPPTDPVRLGVRAGVARWRVHLADLGVGPLRLSVSDWRDFQVGEPADDALTLRTPTWELFRLLFGRRSRAQVASRDWSGAPDAVLDAGLPFPFHWADRDIVEHVPEPMQGA